IDRYMSMFHALMWVLKGFAFAPPYNGCKTGISTSINPFFFMNSRTALMIWDLLMNVSFTLGLEIRSRYLFLYLNSTSCKPCHFSGMGLNDLASIWYLLAQTESSPVFVLNIVPLTPIMSPRSNKLV